MVENKPGAGGTIGIRDTARADPDGYTLVLVSSGHAVNHVLYKDLGYDTLKDLSTRRDARQPAERADRAADARRSIR